MGNTMTDNPKNYKVTAFLSAQTRWQAELEKLREIALSSGLAEDLKWGKPCYSLGGGNVTILFSFKESCAIGFLKGSILPDPKGLLISPGEHSQAMRMLKFTSAEEIARQEPILRAFLLEAIKAEAEGREVPFLESGELELPEELLRRMDELPALKTAFESLTPGRKRAYAIYFSGAKQAKTREDRVEKYIPVILEGKGLND